MCTFVPNGNQTIKLQVEEKPEEAPPAQTPVNEKYGLNPFPGWKSPDEEFVVDL